MASQSDAAVEQVIALYRAATLFGLECCTVSVTALVVYDWVVTLSREVDLFWTGNARTVSAILYFSNKYLNVLSHIVSTMQMAPMSNQSCTRMAIVVRLFLYLSFIPPAAFTALRAYALTRCRWLSALVFLLSSVQFVTNMVGLLGYRVFGIHSAAWGCINGIAIPPSSLLGRISLIANRVSIILADTILVAITWKLLRSGPTDIKGFAVIMLRNGIKYFIVLSVLNILQLVLTVGFSVVPDGVLSYVSYFTDPLSSVLVSHFLLDLQEAHQRTVAGMANNDLLDTSQSISSFSNFPDALAPIGATVIDPAADHGQEEDDEGTDEHLAAVEGIHPREVEPIHESRIRGDELAISEVPRDGVGGVAFGAL